MTKRILIDHDTESPTITAELLIQKKIQKNNVARKFFNCVNKIHNNFITLKAFASCLSLSDKQDSYYKVLTSFTDKWENEKELDELVIRIKTSTDKKFGGLSPSELLAL